MAETMGVLMAEGMDEIMAEKSGVLMEREWVN